MEIPTLKPLQTNSFQEDSNKNGIEFCVSGRKNEIRDIIKSLKIHGCSFDNQTMLNGVIYHDLFVPTLFNETENLNYACELMGKILRIRPRSIPYYTIYLSIKKPVSH